MEKIKKDTDIFPPRGTVYLYLLAVILLAAGLWQGDAQQVLRKVATICLECIGIG